MFTSSKLNRLFMFFDEHVRIFLPSLRATYPIHLACLYLIMLVTFVESFKARSPLLCDFLYYAVPFFLLSSLSSFLLSSLSFFLPSFRTIYSPQHTVLKNHQFVPYLYEKRYSKHQVNYSLRPICFNTGVHKVSRILGARRMTWSKFHIEDPYILGATVKKNKSLCRPGFFFAHMLLCSFYDGGWW